MSAISEQDLSDLNPGGSHLSSGSGTKSGISKSEKSDLSTSKTEEPTAKVEENYTNLDASDVIEYPVNPPQSVSVHSDGSKIGENIKSINNLTNKINDFVSDKSKNIKYEIEGFKRKVR